MKKIVLIALCTAFALSAMAQTKRIAYRSHSGSNVVFALLEDDNLGIPFGYEKGWWANGVMNKDSFAKHDSAFALNFIDSITVKKKQPAKADTALPIKNIPADTLQNQPKPPKIDNKKGEVIDSGKADEKQGSFPATLLVCLLIPTGFAAAFALRQ